MACEIVIKPKDVPVKPIYVGAVMENCSCDSTTTTTTAAP
jgi:hypothetical protein